MTSQTSIQSSEAEYQRDLLMDAIREACVSGGIIRADAVLSGPHCLQFVKELGESAKLNLQKLKEWDENVEYLLKTTNRSIRVCEGGGPENLIASLCLNYIDLRDHAGRKKKDGVSV